MSRSSENLTISAALNRLAAEVTAIVENAALSEADQANQISRTIQAALEQNRPPRQDIWEAAVLNVAARQISDKALRQAVAQAIGKPEFADLGEHEGQTHENYSK